MVSLYYPARPGRKDPGRYATEAEAKLLLTAYGLQDVIPAATFSGTRTHSRPDARPVLGRYPLVLLSPGIDAPRYILTALAEDLASRGYVVAAIDHAYESAGTLFPGGRMRNARLIDRNRIGMAGHSIGGASALAAMTSDRRIRAEHTSFCDFPALADQLGLPGPELSAARAVAITRDYVGAFFDLQLRRIPEPILGGPTAANPEVRFHQN